MLTILLGFALFLFLTYSLEWVGYLLFSLGYFLNLDGLISTGLYLSDFDLNKPILLGISLSLVFYFVYLRRNKNVDLS